MKFLLDTEVNLDVHDHFKSGDYVKVVKDAIVSTPQHVCFTIGLFGEWGTGKSSIVKTVRQQFEATRDQHIKFIEYDAWKYTNDSFRRTFLLRIQQELGFEPSTRFLNFYSTRNTDVAIERKTDKRYLYWSLGVFLIGLAAIWLIKDKQNLKLTIAIIISAVSTFISWLGKAFNDHKTSVQEPLIFAPEQFEECFSEMISLSLQKEIVRTSESKWISGNSYLHGFEKIVIVIDNIDRCTKSTAYELITNIKSFLSKHHSIVFLIPADDEALKKHILKDSDLRESEEFLRKFFNVTIRLKLFNRFDLYDYTAALIQKNGLELSPTTIDIISKEYASTPRRIIQFINNLIAELLLFESKYGNEFRTEHESLICKLLVIREEWPSFYKIICQNPGILSEQPEDLSIQREDITTDLRSFLTFTYSINQGITNETLEILLSAYDRTGDFLFHTPQLLFTTDIESIEHILNNENTTTDKLAEKLIEMLEKGIKAGRNQLYVNHVFEMLCNANTINPLSDDQNRRIYEQTRLALPKFMDYINNFNTVCAYAQCVKPSYDYLHFHILDRIKTTLSTGDNVNASRIGQRLLEATINSLQSEKELKDLATALSTIDLKVPTGIRNMTTSDEKLSYLATDGMVRTLLDAVKRISEKDEYMQDILFLTERIQVSEASVANMISFTERMARGEDIFDTDKTVTHYKLVNKLFRRQAPARIEAVNPSIAKQIQLLKLRNLRASQETDNLGVDINELLADFYLTSYKLSNESLNVSKELLALEKKGNVREHIDLTLLDFKTKYNFHLTGMHEWILEDDSYTESNLALTKFMLLKDGNEAISDQQLLKKLHAMLDDALIGVEHIYQFLLELSENWRIHIPLFSMVNRLKEDSLHRIAPPLLYALYESELDNEAFITSEKGRTIAEVITAGSNNEQRDRIGEIIVNALKKEENSDTQLRLIKAIRSMNPSHVSELSTIILAIKEEAVKAEAQRFINELGSDDK